MSVEQTRITRSRGSEVAERQFCTFYVEGLCFGIGVREVQEVIRYQEMTRVPLAASVVRGLINLRGQIVTADGVVVAQSVPSNDEFARLRTYPAGPLFGHVSGFFSFTIGYPRQGFPVTRY